MFSKRGDRKSDAIEVALPLSSLINLRLNEDSYNHFFENVFSLIHAKNPLKGLSDEEKLAKVSALLHLNDIESVLSIPDAHSYTPQELLTKGMDVLEEQFQKLRDEYKSLPTEAAKEFINKPLHYITNYQGEGCEQFMEAAREFPLPPNSELRFYANWFLVKEKVEKGLSTKVKRLEESLEEANVTPDSLGILKASLQESTLKYREELWTTSMEEPSLKEFFGDADLCPVDEEFRMQALYTLAKEGVLLLPKIGRVTDHSSKDLQDLIKFQFPDDNQYFAEEGSNSRDARASYIRNSFRKNKTFIEDDGHGMSPEMFFKEYPTPYISIKEGEVNIGRFGVGSKSKYVEVLKHKGEVVVESKAEGDEALKQRYFLHDGQLHVSFSTSSKESRGTKITITVPKKSKSEIEEQKQLIQKKLRFFDPNVIDVLIGRRKQNRGNVLATHGLPISHNKDVGKAYFSTSGIEGMVLLSGEVVIDEFEAPFSLVVDVPLTFQPVEGRNDFIYTPLLRKYFSSVFREAVLPQIKGDRKSIECVEWFLESDLNQNPFPHFERYASKDELIKVYGVRYPEKELNDESRIVYLKKGNADFFNKTFPKDIFVSGRSFHPPYVLSLEEFAKESEEKHREGKIKVDELLTTSLRRYESPVSIKEGSMWVNGISSSLFYTSSGSRNLFMYDRESRSLVVNTVHRIFDVDPGEKRDFYASQVLQLAVNDRV